MLKASYPMFKSGLAVALLVCLALVGCQQQQADAVVTGQQVARNVMLNVVEIYNTGNVDMIHSIVSPNYIGHYSVNTEAVVGVDGFTEWVLNNRAAYSDFKVNIDRLIVEGNMVCLQWTVTGTHDGPLRDIEPTGMKIRVKGLTLARMDQGKIAEEWITWDVLDMYQQLGFTVIPPTG